MTAWFGVVENCPWEHNDDFANLLQRGQMATAC